MCESGGNASLRRLAAAHGLDLKNYLDEVAKMIEKSDGSAAAATRQLLRPVCSQPETLWNVGLRRTALDRALLLTSDGPDFLQLIGQVGDTTHELAVIPGALGACHNQVRDRAPAGEHGIEYAGIAAINDDGTA